MTNTNRKWGIMVPLGNELTWVVKSSKDFFDGSPKDIIELFDSREAAEQAAKIWKKYIVVEYLGDKNGC